MFGRGLPGSGGIFISKCRWAKRKEQKERSSGITGATGTKAREKQGEELPLERARDLDLGLQASDS